MNLKEIAIIIAQGLLVLFFIYLIGVGIQTPHIMENLEMREDEKRIAPHKLGQLFEDINENMKDEMNLDEHRTSYQDALSQINENVNLAMLQTLSKTKNTIPNDEDLEKIQKLQQYKNSVSELEEFLDGVKTS